MLRIRDWVLLLIVLFALIFGYRSWFFISEGSVALLDHQQILTPGPHLKWPWQKVQLIRVLPQMSDATLTALTTKDNVHFSMRIMALWQINDLKAYLGSGQPNIDAVLEDTLKQHLTTLFLTQNFTRILTDQALLENMILTNLKPSLNALGVDLKAVKIGNILFSGDSLGTAYANMKTWAAAATAKAQDDNAAQAMQLKEQADDELMQPLSDAYVQAAQIIADGQSQAAKIVAPAYHKNPAFFDYFVSTKMQGVN